MRFIFIFFILCSTLINFNFEQIASATLDVDSDSVVFRDRPYYEKRVGGSPSTNQKNIVSKAVQKCQTYVAKACNGIFKLNPANFNKKKEKNDSHVLRKRAMDVVGGRDSVPKENPHMALIGFRNYSNVKWLCGGSIISERYVLSAAHCSNTSESPARWVRLGELDLSTKKDDADTRDYSIFEIILHPEYKYQSLYNDIVLFKLNTTIKFNSYIQPICLNTGQDLNFNKITALGWGSTGYGERDSPILQIVDLGIQDNQKCEDIYGKSRLKNGFNTSTMICAGYLPGGKDTCQGDSGGPLQAERTGGCSKILLQIGITSFGEGCASPDTLAVYTKVSFYISWIETIVWK